MEVSHLVTPFGCLNPRFQLKFMPLAVFSLHCCLSSLETARTSTRNKGRKLICAPLLSSEVSSICSFVWAFQHFYLLKKCFSSHIVYFIRLLLKLRQRFYGQKIRQHGPKNQEDHENATYTNFPTSSTPPKLVRNLKITSNGKGSLPSLKLT